MKCPICKTENIKCGDFNIYEIDYFEDTNVEYFLCSCSFFYYRHNNIKKLYNENNKYINANTGSGANLKYDLLRLENSFNNIKKYLKQNGKLLDIGCNNGTFLQIINSTNKNIDLYGTDVSLSDQNLLNLNSMGFKIKKTEDPSDFNEKFDFISVLHVLEHIDNIDSFFIHLQKLLNEGGSIYIEVPNADEYFENYFQPFSYFDLEHINHFNLKSLSLQAENFGFEINEYWHFNYKMSDNIYYPGLGVLLKKNTETIARVIVDRLSQNIKEYIFKSQKDLDNYSNSIEFDNKVIFGVGANTLRTLSLLKIDISNLKYFVDNNPIFHNRFVKNRIVNSTEILLNDKEFPDVIVFSKLYFEEIRNDLFSKGYQGKVVQFYK
jgi:2-polyprenyl-3-methyl-5-hydroxy-6-metoxy-1,4-benzoquinol methylase